MNTTIYAYKMTYDDNDAPCVVNRDGSKTNFLSLGLCVPEVRKQAQIGDFLVGIGGKSIGVGRFIYAAKITEIFDAGDYYQIKDHWERHDCVYKDVNGFAVHRGDGFAHHALSPENVAKGVHPYRFINRDVGRKWEKARTLKSTDFRYFGERGFKYKNLLINYNLDRLIHLSRKDWISHRGGKVNSCLPVTSDYPEWEEMNRLLQDIWETYPSGIYGGATHPDEDPPAKAKWVIENNKEVKALVKLPHASIAFAEMAQLRRQFDAGMLVEGVDYDVVKNPKTATPLN